MSEIKVNLKQGNSYKVFIRAGISAEIPAHLKKLNLGNKYAIITDSKVERLYALTFSKSLKKEGIQSEIFSFVEGEPSKNLQTVEHLAKRMIEKGFDRKDTIIALGGGVTGDIAGFLSSIYMRGIPYIQIPTTLLAMVDSSIGGKTGVDLPEGKNLIGTFNQPCAVFIDPLFLKTLSPKHIRNGLSEVIKCSVIKDKELFEFIEKNMDKILSLSQESLIKIIERSVKIKAEIVQKDEKETLGIRQLLNYGHTFGHAIERMSKYKLLHGYAISIGMVLANNLAIEKKLLKKTDAERIKKLLKKADLPILTIQKPTLKDINSDKKKEGNIINFVLPKKIGETIIFPVKCQTK